MGKRKSDKDHGSERLPTGEGPNPWDKATIKEGPRLTIDEYRLDEEWRGQAELYHYWAVMYADAMLDVDNTKAALALAKESLEFGKAESDREIRSDPVAFGIEKLSEARVAHCVLLHPICRAAFDALAGARDDLNKAQHVANILEAAVKSLDHRKKALEKLVDLQGRDYYAEPRASAESREAVEEMEKRASRTRGRRARQPARRDTEDD